MLTTSTEEPDLLEAIKSGANGYLLKSLETGPFLTYLKGVERGEAAISRELSGVLLKAIAQQNEERNKLTTEPTSVETELTHRRLKFYNSSPRDFPIKNWRNGFHERAHHQVPPGGDLSTFASQKPRSGRRITLSAKG